MKSSATTQAASRLKSIGIVSTVARLLQAGVRALIIPISVRVLDTETYGFWMVIGSFVAWFSISDFGIAQMATAQLAAAIGKEDVPGARRVLALALRAYGVVAAVLVLAFLGISSSHLVSRFFLHGTNSQAAHQLDVCLAIVGLTFAVNLVLNVCQVLNTATLRAEANYFASTLGPLISLLLLSLAKLRDFKPTLTNYALIMTLPTTVVLAAVFLFTLLVRCRHLLPNFSEGSMRESMGFLRSSWPIVVSQICDVVIYYLPPVIIAKNWGAREVLSYSLPVALFMQGVNICYGWGQPHTAAYAQAAHQGNLEWVSSRHRWLLLRTAGVFACISLVFAFAGRPLIAVYTAGRVQVPFVLLLSMALLYSLVVASQQNYFLLLGLRRERIRAFVQVGNALAFLVGYGLAIRAHQMFLIPLTGSVGLAIDWFISRKTAAETLGYHAPLAVVEAA